MKTLRIYCRNVFKDKNLFLILFLMVFLLFVIVFAGFSTAINLSNTNKKLVSERETYDYYLNYTDSSSDGNFVKGISPLEIIKTNDLTDKNSSINSDGWTNKFPTVSLINQDVFEFNYDKIVKMISNNNFDLFSFYKTTSENRTYLNILKQTKFAEKANSYFNEFVSYWKNDAEIKIKDDAQLADKMFELVFNDKDKDGNSDNEQNAIELAKTKNINVIENDNGGKVSYDLTELYEKGINSLGQIISLSKNDDEEKKETHDVYFFNNSDVLNWITTKKDNESFGFLNNQGLYDSTWFTDEASKKGVINLNLWIEYLKYFSIKNNFDVKYLNQYIYSNFKENRKILIVDRTASGYMTGDESTNDNYSNVTISKKLDKGNPETINNVIVSNRYAKRNNIQPGDSVIIHSEKTDLDFSVYGTGYDGNNVYPLIYNTSYFPNTKNEAIIYANVLTMKKVVGMSAENILDMSRAMFNYEGNDFTKDFQQLKSDLVVDPLSSSESPIQKDETLSSVMKKSAITYLSNGFFYTFSGIAVISAITILASIFVLISREIKKRASNIGILKANGSSNFVITIEYGLKVFFPSMIGALVAYPIAILIQLAFISIVQPYFDFNFSISPIIFIFIASFVGFVILTLILGTFIAWIRINKRTIDLIDNVDFKKVTPSMKIVDAMKIKKFSPRFTLKQFSIAYKKIFILSLIMFLSSFIMSILLMMPSQISSVKNNYFKSYDYNLQNQYQEQVTNNPLSDYSTYEDTLDTSAIFPVVYQENDSDKKEFATNINSNYTSNALIFNLLYSKGKNVSIGGLLNLISNFENSSVDTTNSQVSLNEALVTFTNRIIPMMMGINEEYNGTDWVDTISKVVAKKMPPELLNYWSDKENRKKFSFDFSSTDYNEDQDEKTTYVSSSYNKTPLSIIGINDSKSLMNVGTSLKNDEIAISKQMAFKENISVGDTINLDTHKRMLQVFNGSGYEDLSRDDFLYLNDDNSVKNISDIDKTKITFEDNQGVAPIGSGTPYYFDENSCLENNGNSDDPNDSNCYKPFYKAQNIVLKIKKSLINESDWMSDSYHNYQENQEDQKGLFVENDEQKRFFLDGSEISPDLGDSYLIRIYDWRYNTKSVDQYEEVSSALPFEWLDDALNVKNDSGNTFLRIQDEYQGNAFKVKKIAKVYDKYAAYINREYLNENILNVPSDYFNAINSKNNDQKDLLRRVGFSENSGVVSPQSLQNLATQTVSSDLILNKLQILDEMYNLILEMSIAFIVIIVVIAIVSTSMVAQQFISQFAKSIFILKTIGYSNGSIHKILLTMLAPFMSIMLILGAAIPFIVVAVSVKYIMNAGFVIPEIITSIPFAFTVVALAAIFMTIYFLSYRNVISSNIAKSIQF